MPARSTFLRSQLSTQGPAPPQLLLVALALALALASGVMAMLSFTSAVFTCVNVAGFND